MNKKFFQENSKNIGSFVSFLKNKKNVDYLEFLNNSINPILVERSIQEKVWYYLNDENLPQLCKCGDNLLFIGLKNGWRKTCGKKECFVEMRKETCMGKFGVDNPKKSKDIIEKEQQNILNKWGGLHYMKDINIRDKFNQKMIQNWGVEWPQQNKVISTKSVESFNKNPNKDLIIQKRIESLKNKDDKQKKQIDEKKKNTISVKFGSYENFIEYRQNKIEEKSLLNWSTTHHLKSSEIIKKRVESYYKTTTEKIIGKLPSHIIYKNRFNNTNSTDSYIELLCKNCNENFNITRQLLYNRLNFSLEPCLKCNPILSGKSNMENDILKFISDNCNFEISQGDKNIINPHQLDIFIPDLKLAFEFNGLYWHSELYKNRTYHLDKTNKCLEKGIQLFHIWEDDWLYKQDIVKSMILNKLGKTSNKIFARKTEIREINNNVIVREFLEKNHIQGFVGSKYKIGLYYNDVLISLMTFGNLRKSLGQKSQEGSYELLRFCNKTNTTVIGGASKLLRYFTDHYKPNEVISYSDYSRSSGNMYKKLGFNLSHLSEPNYYYIIDNMRNHRFNFRKDKLIKEGYDSSLTEIEIMNQRGIYRIFDCGMQKWLITIR